MNTVCKICGWPFVEDKRFYGPREYLYSVACKNGHTPQDSLAASAFVNTGALKASIALEPVGLPEIIAAKPAHIAIGDGDDPYTMDFDTVKHQIKHDFKLKMDADFAAKMAATIKGVTG